MRYFRCKCGERTAWSSMGIYPCERCSKCGSDLAESPNSHREPQPHRMQAERVQAQTDAGLRDAGTLTRCIWCQDTLAEVETSGEPWDHWPNPHQVLFLDGKRYHFPDAGEHGAGYLVRMKLEADRCGYDLFIDEPKQGEMTYVTDAMTLPWGTRCVAVPPAYR